MTLWLIVVPRYGKWRHIRPWYHINGIPWYAWSHHDPESCQWIPGNCVWGHINDIIGIEKWLLGPRCQKMSQIQRKWFLVLAEGMGVTWALRVWARKKAQKLANLSLRVPLFQDYKWVICDTFFLLLAIHFVKNSKCTQGTWARYQNGVTMARNVSGQFDSEGKLQGKTSF